MLEISGDFGQVVLAQDGGDRLFSVPTGSAIEFFKGYTIKRYDPVVDALGMYTIRSAGRNKDIILASIGTPKNLFHKRSGGCAWDPQGKSVQKKTTIPLENFEYDGEECPDAEWGDCLEQLFAPGLGKEDYYSTPEAQALITELVEKVYVGLGNSFFDSITWGNHPLIDASDAASAYTISAADWTDFKKNHSIASGHMAIVDGLKAQGLPQYNVSIDPANTSGTKYSGNVITLFESLEAAMPTELKAFRRSNPTMPLIMSVTSGIFEKYRKELIAQHNGITEGYLLQIQGPDGVASRAPGVLMYNGMAVVERLDWDLFYDTVGYVGHRAMIHAPGVLGLGFDINPVSGYDGMGMIVSQRLRPPYKGKLYMHTLFKAGAAVVDDKYIVNASLHVAA